MTNTSTSKMPLPGLNLVSAIGTRELLFPPPHEILPGATSYLNLPFALIPGYRMLRFDLHLPHGATEPVPVVVYASGGAWLLVMKHHGPWTFLPAAGHAVAVVEYRVSGEARLPAPLHDLKGAVRWLRANASTYNLDPERVGAWGSSAGAYLLSMLAVTNGMPRSRESLAKTWTSPVRFSQLSTTTDRRTWPRWRRIPIPYLA